MERRDFAAAMNTSVRDQLKARKQAFVKDEIITAAERLFAERGVRAVTIDDIATSLGYTKSVVYYYFKNKNQVLWDIFDRIHEAWRDDIQAIVRQDLPPDRLLAALIRKHALNVMDRAAWTAIYFRDQSELTEAQQQTVIERKREFDALFRDVYRRGVEAGLFKDIPAFLVVSAIVGMCNATQAWFKHDGALSAPQIADHFVTIVLDGCRAR